MRPIRLLAAAAIMITALASCGGPPEEETTSSPLTMAPGTYDIRGRLVCPGEAIQPVFSTFAVVSSAIGTAQAVKFNPSIFPGPEAEFTLACPQVVFSTVAGYVPTSFVACEITSHPAGGDITTWVHSGFIYFTYSPGSSPPGLRHEGTGTRPGTFHFHGTVAAKAPYLRDSPHGTCSIGPDDFTAS